ncbi:tripartite motif-containing protein 16-like protein [Puntigrus tetrazona]|uniref:tripartite motif-containing protein 16-like protein n=1 Tax=Puntigrus tetrazona TaxID=1606681 RepID=UPI001C8AEF2D|nr:tripartite motif-containing protein 16-like protein [Puntigrus tetrazona]
MNNLNIVSDRPSVHLSFSGSGKQAKVSRVRSSSLRCTGTTLRSTWELNGRLIQEEPVRGEIRKATPSSAEEVLMSMMMKRIKTAERVQHGYEADEDNSSTSTLHHKYDARGSLAARGNKEGFQHQLKETQKTLQQRIQQREKDLQRLRETVESHKRSAQTAVEDSEKIFTEIIRSIERRRSELIELIRDQEEQAVSRAEGRLERLEQEINDLRRRDAELEQLSHTQDHIQFLQMNQRKTVSGLSRLLLNLDVNDLCSSVFSLDDLRESVHQLRDKLEDFCKEQLKKISDRVTFNIVPRTRNDFLRYSRQFTLDLNTVNKHLRLSENNRVITNTDTDQPYPDHPDRSEGVCQVLCRESVCGRCYWELEWSGDVFISVSYKSIRRKGRGNERWFGSNDQSWSLFCSRSRYSFRHNNIETALALKPISSRVGVYVDHGAGTLSFFSVSDSMSLIHTVQTTFTQTLCPGFSFYIKSSVKLC